jgi:hypothetical protein
VSWRERAGQQGVECPIRAGECERVATVVAWSAEDDRRVAGYVSGYVARRWIGPVDPLRIPKKLIRAGGAT